jgi:type IV pilus assembly protein PilB
VSGGVQISPNERRVLLVELRGLMTQEEFELAHSMADRFQMPLEEALAERGRVPLRFILEQIAGLWDIKFTDLNVGNVQPDALRSIGEEYARKHMLMPFALHDGELSVAMANPRDDDVLHALRSLSGVEVVPYLASQDSINRAHLLYRGNLLELLRRSAEDGRESGGPETRREIEPVADVLRHILEYAAVTGASDIHIEPYQHETLIRYRIDGVLHEVLSEPAEVIQPLTTRIKVLAQMRIDDRRAPQDGRFDGDLGAVKLDLRVSSLPTRWGEKIVIRVLAKEYATIDIETLGLESKSRDIVLRSIARPYGLILITGPTGCGKSTTLYAMLAHLGSERQNLVNISTIEDPVERPLPRVTQVDLNPRAGIDYANGLRALLRQDPDIIMVGEIRDRDTMDISLRAALVGRLLLSTLHTNDAPTAIPRLLDMGAEPYLVASTLSMVVAQRLVRRVCMQCRETVNDAAFGIDALRHRPELAESLAALRQDGVLGADDDLSAMRVFRGKGCQFCNNTGYRGRVGLFEILEIDDDIRRMIFERRDAASIRATALRNGMRTTFENGLAKVLLGETTVPELLRATA